MSRSAEIVPEDEEVDENEAPSPDFISVSSVVSSWSGKSSSLYAFRKKSSELPLKPRVVVKNIREVPEVSRSSSNDSFTSPLDSPQASSITQEPKLSSIQPSTSPVRTPTAKSAVPSRKRTGTPITPTSPVTRSPITRQSKKSVPHKRSDVSRVEPPLPSTISNKFIPKKTSKLSKINQERHFLQSNGNFLISRVSFGRIVKEVTINLVGMSEFKYTSEALAALQEATEAYLTALFEDSYLLTKHAKRVTLYVQDLKLAKRIRGDR